MRNYKKIEAIASINNAISARLLLLALESDGIPLEKVALICGRQINADWTKRCAVVVNYGAKPSLKLIGQYRVAGFFFRAAWQIKRLLKRNTVKEIYIVNNDNILNSHIIHWKEHRGEQPPRLSVIAEGIMNYQDIGLQDRAGWRWKVKPAIAAALGLDYRLPTSHLSGACESAVGRVISFSAHGLKAPPEKISILSFPKGRNGLRNKPRSALIVHTGLWQWMEKEKYDKFAHAFACWVNEQRYGFLYTKPHPFIETGTLQDLLPPHEILVDSRSIEDMAADLDYETVVGTCSTALVTLKLMRPDIRCIDFGANYYCQHAYHGDLSVRTLFEGSGVELVDYDEGRVVIA